MKPVFWSSLFLSVSVPALATAAALASAPLTDWRVTPMSAHNGASYCAMVTRYLNAPVVTYTRNVAGKGSIAFDFKNARLEKDRQYAVTVTLDGQGRTYSGNAINGTTLVLQLGLDNALHGALNAGKAMTISLDGTKGVYTLAGNPTAFAELNHCLAALSPPVGDMSIPPVAKATAHVDAPETQPASQVVFADPQSMQMETPIKTVTILWDNPLHPTQDGTEAGFALSAADPATDSLNAKQLETIKNAKPPTPQNDGAAKPSASPVSKNTETLTLKEKLAKARGEATGVTPMAAPELPITPAPAIVSDAPTPEPVTIAAPVEMETKGDQPAISDATSPAPDNFSEPPAPSMPAPALLAAAPSVMAPSDMAAPLPDDAVAKKPPLREISRMADPFNEPGKSPIGSMAIPTPTRTVDGVTSPDATIQSYLFDEPVSPAKPVKIAPRPSKTSVSTPKPAAGIAEKEKAIAKMEQVSTPPSNDILLEPDVMAPETKKAAIIPPRSEALPPAMPTSRVATPPVSIETPPAPPVAVEVEPAANPAPAPMDRVADVPPAIPTTDVSPAAPTIDLPPALPPVVEPSASPIPLPPQPTRALSAAPSVKSAPVQMPAPTALPRASVAFQPAPADTRGSWVVRSVAGNGAEQAAYCLLENSFANDTRLMLGQRADANSTIGVNYGIDMLENEKNYVVTVQLDNDFEENFTGYAESPHTLVVQMGKKKSFFDALSSANALRVAMPGVASSFKLGRIAEKLDDFSLCLTSIGGTALTPPTMMRGVSRLEAVTPVAADPVMTENLADQSNATTSTPIKTVADAKSQKTGFSQRISTLLRKAAVKPYKYAATETGAHWTDASDKLAAQAIALPQANIGDAAKTLLDDAAKTCAGDFTFRPVPDDAKTDTTAQTFESKCTSGADVTVSTWLVEKDASGLIGYELKAPVEQRGIAFSMRMKLLQAIKSDNNS